MSLRAPIAVPVEIRAPRAGARRVFRLAWNVGEDGVRLAAMRRSSPGGSSKRASCLPGGEALALRAPSPPATATASQGERRRRDRRRTTPDELSFVDPPCDARIALRRYVHERLGLPV